MSNQASEFNKGLVFEDIGTHPNSTKEEIIERVGGSLERIVNPVMSIGRILRFAVKSGEVVLRDEKYRLPDRATLITDDQPKAISTRSKEEEPKHKAWDGCRKIHWPLSDLDKSQPPIVSITVTKDPTYRSSSEHDNLMKCLLIFEELPKEEEKIKRIPRNQELPLSVVDIRYGERPPVEWHGRFTSVRGVRFIVWVYENEEAEALRVNGEHTENWVFVLYQ